MLLNYIHCVSLCVCVYLYTSTVKWSDLQKLGKLTFLKELPFLSFKVSSELKMKEHFILCILELC